MASTARRRSPDTLASGGGALRVVNEHPASSDLTPAFDMCVRSIEYGVPMLWGDEHVDWEERELFIRYGEFRREEDHDDEEEGDGDCKVEGEVPVLSFMDDDNDDDEDDEELIDGRCTDEEDETRRRREGSESEDLWLREARVLDRSIREMSDLLRAKEGAYSDLGAPLRLAGFRPPSSGDGSEMTDAERSELQSAAAAFAAGAANRIEKLRRSLPSSEEADERNQSDVVAHRAGVVACLLARLRSDVADRMERMNASRGRASLDSYRRPYAVRVPLPGSSRDGDVGAAAGKLPPMPSELVGARSARLEEEARAFREAYADNDGELVALLVPPKFAAPPRKKPRVADEEQERTQARKMAPTQKRQGMKLDAPAPTRPKLTGRGGAGGGFNRSPAEVIPNSQNNPDIDPTLLERYGETPEERESYVEDLQRESAYLTAKLHSELDDVRKVEVRMTEITMLLSQFSDLVQEQQSDVMKVSESTKRSKENVEKGKEQLIKAAERGKESKHRMATFIVVLALVMLFLNYITP